MRLPVCLLLASLLALAACSGGSGGLPGPQRCDDGGDGGVMIDGVCL